MAQFAAGCRNLTQIIESPGKIALILRTDDFCHISVFKFHPCPSFHRNARVPRFSPIFEIAVVDREGFAQLVKNLLLPLLNRSVSFLVDLYRESLFAVGNHDRAASWQNIFILIRDKGQNDVCRDALSVFLKVQPGTAMIFNLHLIFHI